MDTIKAFFKNSATILWARIVASVSGLGIILDYAADLLNVPEIHDQLQSIMTPKLVPWYLLGVAIITELARRRTLPK